MYTIHIRSDVPNTTYFRSSDVAPQLAGETLTLWHGKGTRRSWGAPQVCSTVVVETDTFIAVHVGYSHKHRGGQQWYYFLNRERYTWNQLSDALQRLVLDNSHKAPHWAKVPGKRRTETATAQIAYKLVKVVDGKMLSLYDGTTEYIIGKRLVQKARNGHRGGYYAYRTIEELDAALRSDSLVPSGCLDGVDRVALLKCELNGTIITYGTKLAATYLRPLEALYTFSLGTSHESHTT